MMRKDLLKLLDLSWEEIKLILDTADDLKAEFKAGRRLDRQFRRTGFDSAALVRFNEEADLRFSRYQIRTSPVFSR